DSGRCLAHACTVDADRDGDDQPQQAGGHDPRMSDAPEAAIQALKRWVSTLGSPHEHTDHRETQETPYQGRDVGRGPCHVVERIFSIANGCLNQSRLSTIIAPRFAPPQRATTAFLWTRRWPMAEDRCFDPGHLAAGPPQMPPGVP